MKVSNYIQLGNGVFGIIKVENFSIRQMNNIQIESLS